VADALRLHLGCGSHVLDGWLNIDRSPNVHLARVPWLRSALGRAGLLSGEQAAAAFPRGIVRADVTRRIPAADGSAEAVYSSHMIEHLSRWQALALLRECRRVLRPGGLIRIVTPDFAVLIAEYEAGSKTAPRADVFMRDLMTYADPEGVSGMQRILRRAFGASAHQWLYDEESLHALIAEAGFVDVVRREFGQGELPDLDRIETRTGLVLEARAPAS
jgi:predicted SAM-dependent methyltransferase